VPSGDQPTAGSQHVFASDTGPDQLTPPLLEYHIFWPLPGPFVPAMTRLLFVGWIAIADSAAPAGVVMRVSPPTKFGSTPLASVAVPALRMIWNVPSFARMRVCTTPSTW
jgi:hypothetical protein